MENFVQYIAPRRAIYHHSGNTYINGTWNEPRETIVIGEDNECYIERITVSNIPIGFHKSRLIEWIPTQIELF